MNASPLSHNRYSLKAFGRRCPQCGAWTMRLSTVLEGHPITVFLPGAQDDPCPTCGGIRPHLD